MQSNLRPQGACEEQEALSPWAAPFHTQSLLRAPAGATRLVSRGPGDRGAPLPSELQAWVREDMTTKNVSEGQRDEEGWATNSPREEGS